MVVVWSAVIPLITPFIKINNTINILPQQFFFKYQLLRMFGVGSCKERKGVGNFGVGILQ